MPVKKKAKAEEKKEEAKKSPQEKYFYAVGRRKASVAQVKIFPSQKSGENEVVINGRKMKEYFPALMLQNILGAPLKLAGTGSKFRVLAQIKGGGFRGQAEAARLGIARALVIFNEELKKSMRDAGFLTRDARVVERKKAGLKKARRAPQWAKR